MEIYLDNAATTRPRKEVLDVMAACEPYYGNPSSLHALGRQSDESIHYARQQIATAINAKPNEVIFTSSATESNNLALLGYMDANKRKGTHIITTQVEHASVLNTTKYLYGMGYDITYLPVDHEGRINVSHLEDSIDRDTILISVIFANNELGTLQPIKEIGRIARANGICFHTDAVQAIGHCDIDVDEIGIDMLSIAGHKIYTPKGIGAMYVRENIKLSPIIHGGGQEYGLRSGTENVQGIVGLGKAVELVQNESTASHMLTLKNKLISEIQEIPGTHINSPEHNSLDNIVNVRFDGVDGEELFLMLSARGIYVSSGSACSSNKSGPSHVLTAIGLSRDEAYSSLRFSFGRYNTPEEIDIALPVLRELIDNLRKDKF